MDLLSYKKTLIAVVTLTLVSRTVYRFLAWRKKKSAPKQIHEVITFSETAHLIPSKYSYLLSNKVNPSTDRLLCYLNQARYSLDICMHILSNKDISYLIQKLHYKGVKIRFIGDADKAFENKSETKRLFKQDAILLRCVKSEHIMHHKFCIIDAYSEDKKVVPFIITGSLNWTNPGLNGNWESVVVMSDRKIVQLYKNEFEKLWNLMGTPQHSWKIKI